MQMMSLGQLGATTANRKNRRPGWLIDGLAEIVELYDSFLIDQWGVLHDGQKPYPGVIDCLQHLRNAQKQVLVISNSGKGVAQNLERLSRMGITPELYSELVTSGAVAVDMLRAGESPWGDLRDRNALLISDESALLAERLPLKRVERVEDASVIYLAGMDDQLLDGDYDHIVEVGLQMGIPLVCANPDVVRITPQGLKPSAGAVAEKYKTLGGQVWMVGKPYPEIYARCQALALQDGRARMLAIGDSIAHDVRGGKKSGIDTLFISGGIHAADFEGKSSTVEFVEAMDKLVTDDTGFPTWVVPGLRWDAGYA